MLNMTTVKNPNYNPNDPNSKRFVSVDEAQNQATTRANEFNSMFAPFASLISGFKPQTSTQFFDASKFQTPANPASPSLNNRPSTVGGFTPLPNASQSREADQRPRAEIASQGRGTELTIRTGGSSGSIVDELASRGMASDFASRARMAAEAGIQNYQGTAQQNQQLLGLVRSGRVGGNAAAGGTTTPQPSQNNVQQGGGTINIPGVGQVDPDRLSDAELANLARSAGRSGMSFSEFNQLLEARGLPTEQESNEIRNNLGIPDLIDQAFGRPDKSTVETYRELYDIAGLKDVKNSLAEINDRINKKRDDLVEATGELKNNPWLSQGSRTGRLRILNELAFADISNDLEEKQQLLDLYDQGVDEIERQIGFAREDRTENRAITVDQLNFLLTEAEREEGLVQRRQVTRGLRNVPDFLEGVDARETEEFNRELEKERAKNTGSGAVVARINEAGEFIQGTEPPKAPNQSERSSFTFFARMEDAVKAMNAIETEVSELGTFGQFQLQADSPFLQSKAIEQMKQTQRQFTEARLRKDSGAAIPPEEFANDERTYFPQPGDSAETLARKKQAREVTLNSLRLASGRAYWEFYGENPAEVGQRILQAQAGFGAEPTTSTAPTQQQQSVFSNSGL